MTRRDKVDKGVDLVARIATIVATPLLVLLISITREGVKSDADHYARISVIESKLEQQQRDDDELKVQLTTALHDVNASIQGVASTVHDVEIKLTTQIEQTKSADHRLEMLEDRLGQTIDAINTLKGSISTEGRPR